MIEETKQHRKEEDSAQAPQPESIELAEGELDKVSGGGLEWTWTDGGKPTT